jgi:sigma-B regulation protein RsbU (phosphoserine phosphatase)
MPVKILVVDDEPDLELLIRQKFRRQIRAGDYAFSFARNGLEALQKLEEQPDIELVLTDINMPEMDGLTLLMKVNELGLLVKSVIVSAYGDMPNIRTAMNRGAADFLTKPIDFNDLEITLQKTLQQLAMLRQAMQDHDQLLSLRHELDLAASIQQSILPRRFPPFQQRQDFELFAAMIPARDVGGDFYDFFLVDPDHLGFLIADVSGKGIPAALFMAICRTLLKSAALNGLSPAECLQRANRQICLDNGSEMFVTVFYGLLDTRSGAVEYCNAGHNPPYVLRAGGAAEELAPTGDTVLGVFDGLTYHQASLQLAAGDSLLLYTDGVTEAMNEARELFSDRRLADYLAAARAATPQALIDGMVDAVAQFTGAATRSDDLTALALRYCGR